MGIFRMGGVRKTTLARTIYNRMHNHFDCTVWVNASSTSYLGRHVLMDVLQQSYGGSRVLVSGGVGSGQEELELLGKTIGSCLQGKKFLLVLDDVRNTNGWNNVKTILPVLQELS
uniref:Putative disease resistance protein RPM1-like isoform X1 n=1 Tax=Davidia involucrata TaxID=16924 RepID=A0A5B6ZNX1_DAVIN